MMEAKLRCHAVVFDLDGTLVDSFVDAEDCWSTWARSVGATFPRSFDQLYGSRRSEIVQACLPGVSDDDVDRHVEWVRRAERDHVDHVTPLPGAQALLASLPTDRWAIVTSNDREVALRRVGAAGLRMPHVLLTEDEIVQGKPHPEGLLRAAELLDVPPAQVVAVDDSPMGLRAARDAGMPAVAVRYRHPDAALRDATVIVDHVGQLAISSSAQGLVVQV